MSKRTSIMWREGMLDMYGVRKRRCDYHKWLVNANKNYRKPEKDKTELQKFFEECDERINKEQNK